METSNALVSVVICAYANERERQLIAAIASIRDQSHQAHEIIAVIDHNPELQARIAARCQGITVIANQSSRGLSGARNTGVKHATGTVVAFIDDDAVAEPGWLERLVSHYENPAVMGAGGAIVPVWPDKKPPWFPDEFGWVVGCSYIGQPERPEPVRNLIGCNMSFRRNLILSIGGFNEGIGRRGTDAAGCEETELCIKALQQNPHSIILYDPAARVHHQVAPERTLWAYFRKRCLAEGRSKAMMVSSVGRKSGLASERRYMTNVLPRGILNGIANAFSNRDASRLAQAGAILAGLAYTTTSYGATKLKTLTAEPVEEKPFAPISVLDIEIEAALPTIKSRDPKTGEPYSGAFCLLRKNGKPVRILELQLTGSDIEPSKLQQLMEPESEPDSLPRDVTAGRQLPASIVVATRDRTTSLAVTLDSLLAQDYPDFDIVVVDNAPRTKETAELISNRYAATGRIRYVREDKPGLGRAHNAGLAVVTAPVAAFTDDDVIADPKWLSAIMANFNKDEAVGCVTGLILPAELETRAQVWTEKHGGFGKGFKRIVYDLHESRPANALFPYTAGQFGSGANMAFSTNALKSAGNFDPALGAGTLARGGDDLAAFYAIVSSGFKLVYEPGAIVWHHHRRAEEGMRRQAFSYGMGLGAYLAKLVIDRPSTVIRLASLLPAGIRHMSGASSSKMQRLPEDYPHNLIWRERFGIVWGMLGYLRSRRALRSETAAESPRRFGTAVLHSRR